MSTTTATTPDYTYKPLTLTSTTTDTTTTTGSVNTKQDLRKKGRDIGLIIAGTVIILIQLVFYKYSAPLFSAFLSLYTLAFAVIVVVYVYKDRANCETANKTYFDTVSYISFYTIFLQLMLFILSIYAFFKLRSQVDVRSNYY